MKNGGRCPPFLKITFFDFVSALGKMQVNLLLPLFLIKPTAYAVLFKLINW
jgi:hypothetical protein